MDNLTHTLCGLALARTGINQTDRLATATLVIAASLPDLDVVGELWGGDLWYLTDHRGVTHSMFGILLLTPLFALLMQALSRLSRKHPPSRLPPLLLASAVGLISHPLLDGLNTYGVRPFLPFDGTWYYGDVAFIVDPWLWLGFGAAACLGGSRDRRESAYWVVFALLAGLIVAWASRRVPGWVPFVWAAGALAIAAARLRGVGARRPRAASLCVLLLVGAYLGLLASASRIAERQGVALLAKRLPAGQAIRHTSSHPQPAVPWRFKVMVETDTHVHAVTLDMRRRLWWPAFRLARRMDDPDLPKVRHTPEYRAWKIFARHPFVGRQPGRLILGDARYHPRPEPSWCNIPVTLCGKMRER